MQSAPVAGDITLGFVMRNDLGYNVARFVFVTILVGAILSFFARLSLPSVVDSYPENEKIVSSVVGVAIWAVSIGYGYYDYRKRGHKEL